MAKFTKLNIGDSVASSGGRVWKKLSAESAEKYSIVGTWLLNTSLIPAPEMTPDTSIPFTDIGGYFYSRPKNTSSAGDETTYPLVKLTLGSFNRFNIQLKSSVAYLGIYTLEGNIQMTKGDGSTLVTPPTETLRTIILNNDSADVINNQILAKWLINNATKIS